jgi:hypothetical protein
MSFEAHGSSPDQQMRSEVQNALITEGNGESNDELWFDWVESGRAAKYGDAINECVAQDPDLGNKWLDKKNHQEILGTIKAKAEEIEIRKKDQQRRAA